MDAKGWNLYVFDAFYLIPDYELRGSKLVKKTVKRNGFVWKNNGFQSFWTVFEPSVTICMVPEANKCKPGVG